MDLHIPYAGELRVRLEQYAPDTNRALSHYAGLGDGLEIFDDSPQHQECLEWLRQLPDVANQVLSTREGIEDTLLRPLDIQQEWISQTIGRTLDAHFERCGYLERESPLQAELTIVLARTIPLFLLETYKSEPQMQLFGMMGASIQHYVPLPEKDKYVMLLSQ
jgi:hypothetical protein